MCVLLVPHLGDGGQGHVEISFAGSWWPETESQPRAKHWLGLLRMSFRGWVQRPMRLQTQSNFFGIHGYCKCDVLIWGHARKGKRNLALQKWSLGYSLSLTLARWQKSLGYHRLLVSHWGGGWHAFHMAGRFALLFIHIYLSHQQHYSS